MDSSDEEEYQMSGSEGEYSKEDKILLETARKSMMDEEGSSEEEVYGFGGGSDDEDEEEEEGKENDDIDMGSDIAEEEQVPDDRAWGKRKKSFYNTDFVDQDYEGIYQGEEAEIAELEEQEAKNIQKRLIEQLNDADFSISEAVDIAETSEVTASKEVIQSDLSKLTKRQKLDLLKKESPEFFVLVEDFKEKLLEAQKFLPVINYFEKKVNKPFPALQFLQMKLAVILNYCTNISYYLFLKAKRIPVKNHPILKSLFKYRQLLEQIENIDKKTIQPQLDVILEMLNSGKEIPLDESVVGSKKKLKLLSKKQRMQEKKKKELLKQEKEGGDQITDIKMESEDENKEPEAEEEEEEKTKSEQEKRAITYEMAKNKGLIPKRSKEQRNPRVKHRRKYEKAKIRRRGQVRTPRTEIPVYGGEPTGIKINLTKGIKLKY